MEHSLIQPKYNYENSYKIFFIFFIIYSILLKLAYLGFGIIIYPFVKEKSGFVYCFVVVGMILMLAGDIVFRGITIVNERRLLPNREKIE